MSDPNNTESVVIPVKLSVDEKSVKTAEKDVAKAAEKLDKAKEVAEAKATRTRKGIEQKRQYEEYVAAGAHAQKLSKLTTQYYKSANKELQGLQTERIRFTKKTNDEIFRIDGGARKREAQARAQDIKADQRANQAAFNDKIRTARQATSAARQGARRTASSAVGMRQAAQAGGAAIQEANRIATGMYQTAALAPGADRSAAAAAMAAVRDKAVQVRLDRSMFISGRAARMRAQRTNLGGMFGSGGRFDRFGAAWSAPVPEGGSRWQRIKGQVRQRSYAALNSVAIGILGNMMTGITLGTSGAGVALLKQGAGALAASRDALQEAAMGTGGIEKLNKYAWANRKPAEFLGYTVDDVARASGVTRRSGAGTSGLRLLAESKSTGMSTGEVSSALLSLRGTGTSKANVWRDFSTAVATGVSMGFRDRQGVAQAAISAFRSDLAVGRGGIARPDDVLSAATAYTGFHGLKRMKKYSDLGSALQATAFSPDALMAGGVGRDQSLMQYSRGIAGNDEKQIERQVQFYRNMARDTDPETAEFQFMMNRLGGVKSANDARIFMQGRKGGKVHTDMPGSAFAAMKGPLWMSKRYDAWRENDLKRVGSEYFDTTSTLTGTYRGIGRRGADWIKYMGLPLLKSTLVKWYAQNPSEDPGHTEDDLKTIKNSTAFPSYRGVGATLDSDNTASGLLLDAVQKAGTPEARGAWRSAGYALGGDGFNLDPGAPERVMKMQQEMMKVLNAHNAAK